MSADPAQYKTLLVSHSHDGAVLHITFNRPETLNGWNSDFIQELLSVLNSLSIVSPIRIVVFTGAGRGFSAGADLNYLATRTGEYSLDDQQRTSEVIKKIVALPQIFIAAVNGVASGAGFSLALACDLRVCVPSARFNAMFVRLGLSGGELGSSFFLPRLIGLTQANKYLLTGDFIDAQTALRTGLVNDLYDSVSLMNEGVNKLIEGMLATSKLGLRLTKQSIAFGLHGSLNDVIDMEDRQQVLCMKDEKSMQIAAKHFNDILNKKKAKKKNTNEIPAKL